MNIYDSSNIEIFTGLEGIKKRPEMYIGNINDGTGLHHLLFEVITNSIDEVMINECDEIVITLNKDNSICIKDNGRGIPVDIKINDIKIIKRSAVEIVFSELHSGGKFNNTSYAIAGGLHGLGLSCVNALSEWLKVIIYKNNKINFIKFKEGTLLNHFFENLNKDFFSKTNIINETNLQGTEIIFLANKKIFNKIKYDSKLIINKIRELTFLNKNLKIIFINKILNVSETFLSKEGLFDFIKFLNKEEEINIKKILYINNFSNLNSVEIILKWNNSKNNIFCYTNSILQKDGGSHFEGLKQGLLKFIKKNLNKKKSKNFKKVKAKDILEGIICIISVKSINPKFTSQVKSKLISNEIRLLVKKSTIKLLENFFKKNKNDLKILINKIIKNIEIRSNKNQLSEINKKKFFKKKYFCNKLAECQEKNPCKKELYIVEGDSAGGSAKQGRNRKFQAILSLKGKVLNVEKSNYSKLLNSEQMMLLMKAIGCNIKNKFNLKKIRYKKIIIMTDADVDGAHIRTLLLTFFYRYIPELIKLGYIYVAQPPLYKIVYNKKEKYIKNENHLTYFIIKNNLKKIKISYINSKKEVNKKKLKNYILLYIYLIKSVVNLDKICHKKFLEYIINGLEINIENLYNSLITAIKIKKIKISKFTKLSPLIFISNKNSFNLNVKVTKFNFIINSFTINNEFLIKIKYFKLRKKYLKLNSFLKKGLIFKNKNKINKIFKFNEIIKFLKKNKNTIKKQRYKGLGEMNSNQLWSSTMNPKKRTLIKIKINNKKKTNKMFEMLMGKEVIKRKKFITKNFLKVKNLCI